MELGEEAPLSHGRKTVRWPVETTVGARRQQVLRYWVDRGHPHLAMEEALLLQKPVAELGSEASFVRVIERHCYWELLQRHWKEPPSARQRCYCWGY